MKTSWSHSEKNITGGEGFSIFGSEILVPLLRISRITEVKKAQIREAMFMTGETGHAHDQLTMSQATQQSRCWAIIRIPVDHHMVNISGGMAPLEPC